MGWNNQIKVGKDFQDHQTQPPSELKVHHERSQKRIHRIIHERARGAGGCRGDSRPFLERFSPLENGKSAPGGRAQPRLRGARGGWQALPAMQKPWEPGRSRTPRGGIMYRERASPSQGWAGCWKKSQFWVHRGFIPVLPHCIGKCNSLAWELGLIPYGDRKTRREGGGMEGGWDSHPWDTRQLHHH